MRAFNLTLIIQPSLNWQPSTLQHQLGTFIWAPSRHHSERFPKKCQEVIQDLCTAGRVEVVISIGDSAYMQAPVAYTQRLVIERPSGGNIGGNDVVYVGFMRTWDQREGHWDFPLRWPIQDRKY